MALREQHMTAEEFDRLAALPENADRLLEFVAGEIIEVPSNPYASMISSLILTHIGIYLLEHRLGYVTGEAGGYMVAGERYAPDVAFISYAKQPELARQGYNPNPPDLAVEVDYPSTLESQRVMRAKILNYMAAGTILWLFIPETQSVEIYAPGQPVRYLGVDDTLDGGEVLPGFTLPVKAVFREAEAAGDSDA